MYFFFGIRISGNLSLMHDFVCLMCVCARIAHGYVPQLLHSQSLEISDLLDEGHSFPERLLEVPSCITETFTFKTGLQRLVSIHVHTRSLRQLCSYMYSGARHSIWISCFSVTNMTTWYTFVRDTRKTMTCLSDPQCFEATTRRLWMLLPNCNSGTIRTRCDDNTTSLCSYLLCL